MVGVVVDVAAGAAIVPVAAVLVFAVPVAAVLAADVLVVGAVPDRLAADPVADLVVGAAGRSDVGALEVSPYARPHTLLVGIFAVPQDLAH